MGQAHRNSEGTHPRHSASTVFGSVAVLIAGIAGGCASSRPPLQTDSTESLTLKLLEGRGGSEVRQEAIRRLVANCFGMRPEWEAQMPTGLLCHIARFGTPCEVHELVVCMLKSQNCDSSAGRLILNYALGNPSLDPDTKQKAAAFLAGR